MVRRHRVVRIDLALSRLHAAGESDRRTLLAFQLHRQLHSETWRSRQGSAGCPFSFIDGPGNPRPRWPHISTLLTRGEASTGRGG